jgi:hypothetical protein
MELLCANSRLTAQQKYSVGESIIDDLGTGTMVHPKENCCSFARLGLFYAYLIWTPVTVYSDAFSVIKSVPN